MSAGPTARPRWRGPIFVITHIVGLAALYLGLVMPALQTIDDGRDSIRAQRAVLARLRGAAEKGAAIEKLLEHSREASRGAEFLTGATEGVVNAGLQARLKSVVEAAGAQFRSVRSLAPREADALHYTGARVEISGTARAVQKAAYEIEAAKPMLFILAAIVRPSGLGRVAPSAPGRETAAPEEPNIDAQFDVLGATQGKRGDE